MSLIVFLPALIAFVWSLVLALKKNKLLSHRLAAVMFFFVALSCAFFVNYASDKSTFLNHIMFMSVSLCVPPINYMLFLLIFDSRGFNKNIAIAMAMLNVSIVFLSLILYMSVPADIMEAFYDKYILGKNVAATFMENNIFWYFLKLFTYYIFRFVLGLEIVAVMALATLKLIGYSESLSQYFVDSDGHDVKVANLGVAANCLTTFAIIIVLMQPYMASFLYDKIPTYVNVVLISSGMFLAGLSTYKTKKTAIELNQIAALDTENESPSSVVPDTEADAFKRCLQRVTKAMNEDKVFLNPDISLVSLAEMTGTNRTYLSKVINFNFGSISDYINRNRINHFMEIMKEHPEKSIKEAAFESGFNNTTSFYRNCVKFTGRKPSDFGKP